MHYSANDGTGINTETADNLIQGQLPSSLPLSLMSEACHVLDTLARQYPTMSGTTTISEGEFIATY